MLNFHSNSNTEQEEYASCFKRNNSVDFQWSRFWWHSCQVGFLSYCNQLHTCMSHMRLKTIVGTEVIEKHGGSHIVLAKFYFQLVQVGTSPALGVWEKQGSFLWMPIRTLKNGVYSLTVQEIRKKCGYICRNTNGLWIICRLYHEIRGRSHFSVLRTRKVPTLLQHRRQYQQDLSITILCQMISDRHCSRLPTRFQATMVFLMDLGSAYAAHPSPSLFCSSFTYAITPFHEWSKRNSEKFDDLPVQATVPSEAQLIAILKQRNDTLTFLEFFAFSVNFYPSLWPRTHLESRFLEGPTLWRHQPSVCRIWSSNTDGCSRNIIDKRTPHVSSSIRKFVFWSLYGLLEWVRVS